MVNLLIMTKVHYTVDILGGLIFAAFMHKASRLTVLYTDKAMSFPYVLGLKIYKKLKRQEESRPLN
jgi:hypothetical protein